MSYIAREVTAQIAAVLGEHPERITPNALLVQDLGADSLDSVALALAIEDRFAIDMPDEEVEQLCTVRQLIEYVELAVAMASPATRGTFAGPRKLLLPIMKPAGAKEHSPR